MTWLFLPPVRFLLSTSHAVRTELENVIRVSEEEIVGLTKQRDYLAAAVEDCNVNVREFVQASMKQ